MSLIYQSLDAYFVKHKPAHPCQCGVFDWQRQSETVDSYNPAAPGHELRLCWYVCSSCKDETERYFVVNRREKIWTAEQVKFFRATRQRKDWSLKDVTTYTGISVSRLSDFERRMAGATDNELAGLRYFGLLNENPQEFVWIDMRTKSTPTEK